MINNPFPLPPPLERQVTQGGIKQVVTSAIAIDSGRWVVVQQGGNIKITKFLRAAWNGENLGSADFDLTTLFWFHISNPEGTILNLHVCLGGLVARLASLGIHNENNIYLIKDQEDAPNAMDNDFEARLGRLLMDPGYLFDEGNNNTKKNTK